MSPTAVAEVEAQKKRLYMEYSAAMYTQLTMLFIQAPVFVSFFLAQYKGAPFGELSPHVFTVADASYRAVMSDAKSQSILVSGENHQPFRWIYCKRCTKSTIQSKLKHGTARF
ncbi:unnamed protein product [Lactuca virosa]|uniref:Myosin motor domain-containing protein n=1 Tax=Lactuca virosa TaxID=75947 RepID=A0AAU9PWY4_9ASTR|nr:unnamed protein product [Lactuca virosa]